jgi:hypothetical protein
VSGKKGKTDYSLLTIHLSPSTHLTIFTLPVTALLIRYNKFVQKSVKEQEKAKSVKLKAFWLTNTLVAFGFAL